MRIAFLVGAFPQLSEPFILNQITGLIDRGHHVDIYAYTRGDASTVHADVRQYALLERTAWRPHWPDHALARIGRAGVLLVQNFHRNPAALLRALNVLQHGRCAASLRLLYDAVPYLDRQTYDIVHCHFGPTGVWAAQVRALGLLPGRLVTAFHGFDMSIYVKQYGRDVYRRLFAEGDLFLPVSERWRARLIELGCPLRKIQVHHMGVSCNSLRSRTPLCPPGGAIRVISVARLVEKKGLDDGIRAVAALRQKHRNLEYDIIGDGLLRDPLQRLIGELGVADCVHLLGWRDQEAVRDLVGGSHIFLCPSRTSVQGDEEGIPVVLMEAMAMGLPIVATRHSGIPELVQDGLSGFLVPEHDSRALAERLDGLIVHPEKWPEMGRAGRAWVEAHYCVEKLNDRLVELFGQLLQGAASPSIATAVAADSRQSADGMCRRENVGPATLQSMQE